MTLCQWVVRKVSWGFCPIPRKKAIGLSLSAEQRLARLTRKKGHRPFAKCCSALSEFNPQKPAFGCKQLSGRLLLPRYQKSPYMPLIFDGLYFLRCTQFIYSYYLMDYKIGVIFQSLYYPFAFFGVLRTFFAKKVLSRRRQKPFPMG